MSDSPTLRPRQERFVQEYLKDFSGIQAAIRAGYSPNTARVISTENLLKPAVAKRVEEAKRELALRLTMQADEVAKSFTKIARFDVRKLFTEDQQLKPIHELDDDTAYAIASIEVRTEVVKGKRGKPPKTFQIHKIKAHDKAVALQHLGRIHGIFRDKVEVNATLTLESLVLGAMKRGEQLEAPASKPTEAPLTIEGKVEESNGSLTSSDALDSADGSSQVP